MCQDKQLDSDKQTKMRHFNVLKISLRKLLFDKKIYSLMSEDAMYVSVIAEGQRSLLLFILSSGSVLNIVAGLDSVCVRRNQL